MKLMILDNEGELHEVVDGIEEYDLGRVTKPKGKTFGRYEVIACIKEAVEALSEDQTGGQTDD